MGFFSKLFDKKTCAFCGEEIGLLGNRKLEDGNMCKTCARKLSVWFDDRRHSTVEQIGQQLAYREENKARVAEFRVSRSFGGRKKVHVDEDAGLFLVTDEDNPQKWVEDNPDVLALTDITGCELDIDEHRQELTYRDKEGKSVSYNPPRYRYDYNFDLTIRVRSPWFDDMRLRLNDRSISLEPQPVLSRSNAVFAKPLAFNPEIDPEYRSCLQQGEELRDYLLQARQQQRREAAQAAAPKAASTCPWCGATTSPDASGCCEYCGGAMNG